MKSCHLQQHGQNSLGHYAKWNMSDKERQTPYDRFHLSMEYKKAKPNKPPQKKNKKLVNTENTRWLPEVVGGGRNG